ncbi:MAG: type II toxin-antitoxin system RelE/ParE family toxin [Chitinophagales bacterium]|nr:type II toxin-antitoxin system RelE/ParE family toxin [Chitinophagales bacterium]
MRVEVQKSFEKDIEKITDKKLAEQVASVIQELENCKAITEIRSVKKMKAKGLYFRIRIGNYRLGLSQNQNTVTLLRFMHRKDIYTYFP